MLKKVKVVGITNFHLLRMYLNSFKVHYVIFFKNLTHTFITVKIFTTFLLPYH